MAYEDYDFATEEEKLLQQQARIDALRKQGARSVELPGMAAEGFQSAVTGARIPGIQQKLGWGAALQPLVANLGADYQSNKLIENKSEMSKADQEALSNWIGQRPVEKQVTEPLGPNDITGSFDMDPNKAQAIQFAIADMKDPVERANAQKAFDQQRAGVTTKTRTVQPTRDELMKWAASGQKGGVLTRSLSGKTLEDLTVNAQKREEDRLARAHEKEIAGIAARQREIEAANLKRELEASRSGDRRYVADQGNATRLSVADQAAQTRRDVAEIVKSGRASPKDTLTPFGEDAEGRTLFARNGNENDIVTGGYKHAEGSQKAAPVSLITAYSKNSSAMKNMEKDYAAVIAPGAKNATGIIKGAIPAQFVNKIWNKEEEVTARIAVANILNTRVHDLSGAATSVQELFRLSQNLPTASDDQKTLMIKIPRLMAELEAHNKALDDLNTAQGYKSLSGDAKPPPPRAKLPLATGKVPPAASAPSTNAPGPGKTDDNVQKVIEVTQRTEAAYPAAKHAGQTAVDDVTGIKLKSNGKEWVEVN